MMLIEAPTMPVRLSPPAAPSRQVTDADVYERAADIIDERGWTKGEWEASDGRVCILGAIGVAAIELEHPIAESLWFAQERDTQVMAAAELMVGTGNSTKLYRWNDRLCDERRGFLFLRKVAAVDLVKSELQTMAHEARVKENGC